MSQTEDQTPDYKELITIARVVRPRGNKGEVIAELMTDFPDRFSGMESARLRFPNGDLIELKIENSWMQKGRIVLKFAGYDDMNAAELLRDSCIVIDRSELVELPEDTWYAFDLHDCKVMTIDGLELGLVTGIHNYGSAPLLVVSGEDDKEIMIPMTQSICPEVDIDKKRIIVDPPEGLLDL